MAWDDDNGDTRARVAMAPFHTARRLGIPGAGHMVHFEQPGALARATEDFLQNS